MMNKLEYREADRLGSYENCSACGDENTGTILSAICIL